jgi:hypothetical protein
VGQKEARGGGTNDEREEEEERGRGDGRFHPHDGYLLPPLLPLPRLLPSLHLFTAPPVSTHLQDYTRVPITDEKAPLLSLLPLLPLLPSLQPLTAPPVSSSHLQDYTRVPITDEKAPKDSDFELLIRRLWDVPLNAALMFNCQMGRGRTTTGEGVSREHEQE